MLFVFICFVTIVTWNEEKTEAGAMYILYIYDLNAANRKRFNQVKRLFYYHLNKLPLKKELWKTKSALAVPARMEKAMDSFFRRFRKDLVAYKCLCEEIERLE